MQPSDLESELGEEEEEGEGLYMTVFPEPLDVYTLPLLPEPRYLCTAVFPHASL